jgi:aminopeptidase N
VQFRRWYHQAGTPVLQVLRHWDREAGVLELQIRQHTPPTPGQPDKLALVLYLDRDPAPTLAILTRRLAYRAMRL